MRIGVNVPNELLRRVKEIEPRVNISLVCREALESRVEVADRAQAQAYGDGVDEHVARLVDSVNGPMIEPDWVAYAIEDAANRADEWESFSISAMY